jgi:hypothetical protein
MNTAAFKKIVPYLPIPILVIINSIISLKNANENVHDADPHYYMKLAKEFPHIWDTTFPVFYPIVIKIINIFCGDYYISTKVICLLALWVIFSTVSFLETNYWTRSETLLVPLLLIFSHLSYQYLIQKTEVNKSWIWKFSLILILMCTTKYSCVFIVAAIYFYILMYFIIKRKILSPLLLSCVVCTIFMICYLLYNKYITGYYTGPRISTLENPQLLNIRLSFFSAVYCLNPVINSRLIFGYTINYLILFFVSIALYIPLIFNIIRKKLIVNSVNIYFLNIGIIFFTLTTASYFVTKIDNLNARLLLPAIYFIFLFVGMLIKNKKNIFLLSYLSLTLCILDNIYVLIYGQSL